MRVVVTTCWLLCLTPLISAAPAEKALSAEALANGARFAQQVHNVTTLITREYARPISHKALYAEAIKTLYATARQPEPEPLLAELREAQSVLQMREVLVTARAKLHDAPQLTPPRDLLLAINSFTKVLDPASVLLPSAALNGTATASRFGFEFEGEAQATVGLRPRGRLRDDDDAPVIATAPTVPFRVLYVKPGSPAQKAGLRPNDQITHINSLRADSLHAEKAFATLHQEPADPTQSTKHTLIVDRIGQTKPLTIHLQADDFVPESLFGVKRKANNDWDYWIDREHKLGYVRLGAIEHDSGTLLSEILHDLRDMKGLLFDLRWCPGGYIDSATQIASTFLEQGVIAKMTYRNPARGEAKEIHADGGLIRYKAGDYPVLVLVNGETVGGGELIAAALKDNQRAVLAGTRTHGKATIQWPETIRELPGYSFKITGGTYSRPNGKNLQRYPDSKPTDDWGLLPDEGYTIPTSADLAKKLREMHTLYALRPGHSREALDLDDPDTDPQRVRAVKLLRDLVTRQAKGTP